MPNANVTVYFTDDEYVKYAQHKEEANAKIRKYAKKVVTDLK